ncbi:hypothetical protein SDC9_142224 [bioreactor metagenome]|uniref:Uncharacterized protein n=1 Tax=bioreactor metagenome TaxID=1076179 RepID=A0A645E2M4_9ZZZZ
MPDQYGGSDPESGSVGPEPERFARRRLQLLFQPCRRSVGGRGRLPAEPEARCGQNEFVEQQRRRIGTVRRMFLKLNEFNEKSLEFRNFGQINALVQIVAFQQIFHQCAVHYEKQLAPGVLPIGIIAVIAVLVQKVNAVGFDPRTGMAIELHKACSIYYIFDSTDLVIMPDQHRCLGIGLNRDCSQQFERRNGLIGQFYTSAVDLLH